VKPNAWPMVAKTAYKNRVDAVKRICRLSGHDAELWIDWVCNETAYPAKLAQRLVSELVASNVYVPIPANISDARQGTELVKEHHLDISDHGLMGIAFRHIYFQYDDFVELFETEPGMKLPAQLGHHCLGRGYPYRCPTCQAVLVKGETARSVLEENPWVKISTDEGDFLAIPCNNCEEYLVPLRELAEFIGDLFVPFQAVHAVQAIHPGTCL